MTDEKLTAREKANQYRKTEHVVEHVVEHVDEHVDDKRHGLNRSVRTEEEWADIVDRQITEAMRQGAFENLPGRGKPLNLSRDAMVPDDQQMAFRLLRNNDLAPAWIGERKDIQARIGKFYERVLFGFQSYSRRFVETSDSAERLRLQNRWRQRIEGWETEIRELNRRILSHNLQQPVAHLEIIQIHLDEALRRAGAGRELTG